MTTLILLAALTVSCEGEQAFRPLPAIAETVRTGLKVPVAALVTVAEFRPVERLRANKPIRTRLQERPLIRRARAFVSRRR